MTVHGWIRGIGLRGYTTYTSARIVKEKKNKTNPQTKTSSLPFRTLEWMPGTWSEARPIVGDPCQAGCRTDGREHLELSSIHTWAVSQTTPWKKKSWHKFPNSSLSKQHAGIFFNLSTSELGLVRWSEGANSITDSLYFIIKYGLLILWSHWGVMRQI